MVMFHREQVRNVVMIPLRSSKERLCHSRKDSRNDRVRAWLKATN
jgi:hypothetical protein